jgi:hypothetical protein
MEIFCLQLETFCRCALPWALAKAIPCFKAGNLRSSARGLKTEPTWVIPCFKAGNLRTSARARKLIMGHSLPKHWQPQNQRKGPKTLARHMKRRRGEALPIAELLISQSSDEQLYSHRAATHSMNSTSSFTESDILILPSAF